jgi:excisionase family DNA binding protein
MKTLEFTNIQDASTLTGIPYRIIYAHIKSKHLPAKRLEKIFLINREDLLAFVEARRNGKYCKAGQTAQASGNRNLHRK